jgi:YggT family protein
MSVILSNLSITLARILELLVPLMGLLKWIIIIRVILSWVNADPYNFLVQIIYKISEPLMAPFRNLIPSHRIGLDFSPLLAILTLVILQIIIINFFVPTLLGFAAHIG